MTEWVNRIGLLFGIVVAVLGIIGGLLALPDKWKAFRTGRWPLGKRGTTHLVLQKKDGHDSSTVTYLVEGDLFHFVSAYGGAKLGAEVQSLERVGDYYKLVIIYPLSVVDNLVKVKNTK